MESKEALMQQRRKRLSRRVRDEIVALDLLLKTECNECFERSRCCRAHGDDAYHCNNDCQDCKDWAPACQPSSTCSGSQDATLLVRYNRHGDPWNIKHRFI